MPLSFLEAEQLHLIVGQDGILRAGWQPARADLSTAPTCPTTSAGFPAVGKLSSSNHECSQHLAAPQSNAYFTETVTPCWLGTPPMVDRKSTRLNSSHLGIS